jgi:hypothetical protein
MPFADQPPDFAGAQNAVLKCTGASFTRSSVLAAVVHAVLIFHFVPAAVVGEAQVDLLRVDVIGPK